MSTLFVVLLSEEFDQKLLDIEDVNKENPTLAIDAKVGFLFFRNAYPCLFVLNPRLDKAV